MRQVNVSLPDDLRAKLDAAADAANRGLAEEIRDRLQESFDWGRFDAPTRSLLSRIGFLASLTRPQTGRDWFNHAGAHHVFRRAIEILLGRSKPEGKPVLSAAELPADRPVVVTDLEAMAAGLEAIVSLNRPLHADEHQRVSQPPTTPEPTSPYARGAVSPLDGRAVSRETKKR
jgi:hypothetical protein